MLTAWLPPWYPRDRAQAATTTSESLTHGHIRGRFGNTRSSSCVSAATWLLPANPPRSGSG